MLYISKLINLLSYVFKGDESNALKYFKEIYDEGLDGKLFLNDVLEIIYLLNKINIIENKAVLYIIINEWGLKGRMIFKYEK